MIPPTTGPAATLGFWILLMLLLPVLVVQALWTAWRTPRLPEAPGPREGYANRAGETRSPAGDGSVQLLVVGESTSVGVGVAKLEQGIAAGLSRVLAARGAGTVHWRVVGANGARVAAAAALVERADPLPTPDLVLVPMGVNDTVKLSSLAQWRSGLGTMARALRARGATRIAFASVPPVGWFTALPRPLRWVLGWRARQLDRALLEWCAEAGPDVHYLPIRFPPLPELLAEDGYHPGEEGYRRWASLLADQLLANGLITPAP